jgi:hypothetical protein
MCPSPDGKKAKVAPPGHPRKTTRVWHPTLLPRIDFQLMRNSSKSLRHPPATISMPEALECVHSGAMLAERRHGRRSLGGAPDKGVQHHRKKGNCPQKGEHAFG